MKHSPIRALAVIGAALVLMSGGAFVYATANPGDPPVITGCVNKVSGVIRIIDASATHCTKNETALSWNQAGVPGTSGTPGTNGTDGVSGYQVVQASGTFHAGGTDTFAFSTTLTCPSGKKALSGFGTGTLIPFLGPVSPAVVASTELSADADAVTFRFVKSNGLAVAVGEAVDWRAQVVCAAVS